MTEIQIKKRYKSAGNVFNALLGIGFDPETASSFLNDINDADVVEVRHGEWIPITDEPTPLRECAILSGYECSECGRYEKEKQPYCHCGAKMDGERKDSGNA